MKSQLPLCALTSLLCYNTLIASTGSQLSARASAIVSLDRSKVAYLPGRPQTIAGRSNTWIHRIAGYICTSQLHLSFVGLLSSLELRSEELMSLSFPSALPQSSPHAHLGCDSFFSSQDDSFYSRSPRILLSRRLKLSLQL